MHSFSKNFQLETLAYIAVFKEQKLVCFTLYSFCVTQEEHSVSVWTLNSDRSIRRGVQIEVRYILVN